MKFLSDILAKAGLTVDGVVTLNNTATGQTPNANDNSTKLATTAWVRTFVQPYSLPIATSSVLGGIKVGTGLSIDAGTGVLSVSGGGSASIKSTQTFTATAGQTVFTISGGYSVGLIDVFLNGVYLSPNQTTATNGTTITLGDAALAGDIIDVIIASPVYQGATTTTDQLSEGSTNLYFTNARARAAISESVTGLDYNSATGVFSITTGYGIPTTASQTTWDAAYNDKINSAAVTGTTTKTLTLTQQDGGTITASWTDDNTDAVTSVFGRTGAVVATSGDYTTALVTEVTNLYYTDARARAAISVTGSGSYDSATGIITVTGGVTSVNTLTGAVTLTTTNIGEGTNLYYTTARANSDFDTRLGTKSTTNLAEGTNLYYTTARANSDFDTRLATKSTTNLAEGTNLYYTDTRVGTYLTGNSYATQSYVSTQINNLVSGAPGLLDTLDELAAALGDDPNFATTVTTALGNRLRIDTASQGLTGTQQGYGRTNLGLGSLATLSSIGDAYITDLAYSKLTGVPSTFAPSAHTHDDRYYTETEIGNFFSGASAITGYNKTNWDTAYGWGNHASGGYLTTASAASTYVSLSGSYANPSWITSLAYSKITGVPAFITSYTEVDTLASVTGRGTSTSTALTLSGGATITGLTIAKSGTDSIITFPAQLNDPAYIKHYESNNTAIMYFVASDDANDYFHFGYYGNTGAFQLRTDGVVTTGTWQGTAIADTYISSAATWNAKQNALNGTGFVKISGTTISYDNNTYLTGITSTLVTNALGFTPYNSSNPSGYISSYTETDTLATVTGRGATTTAAITVTASEGREVSVYMASSYTTDDLVSGHEYGWYNDHWRLGMTRSGGAAGADFVVQWNAARRLSLTSGGNLTVTGTISSTNFSGTHSGSSSGTNTGDQTNISGLAASETLATVTSRGGTTSSALTLSNIANTYSGHHYFSSYDADGNHYPHYNVGGNNNGSKLNLRMFSGNGSTVRLFSLNGQTGAISWDGNAILHAGNYNSYAVPLSGGTMTGQLTITGARLLVEAGGTNTYGLISGYNNNNHFMTMRGAVSGATSSPTITGSHQMTFIEYAEAGDSTGWYFKSSSSGTYEEIAKITRTGIKWSGNLVWHAGNLTNLNQLTNGPGYITGVSWSSVTSKPSDVMYYAGFTLDADTMPSNSTGFTYSVNAPLTGPIVKFSTGGGYDLQINAPYYWGNEMYFRVRNGDLGVWRSWKQVLNAESHSYAANMNQHVRTTDNVTFNAVNISANLNLPNNALIVVNGETDTWGARFRTTTSTTNLGAGLKNIIWTGGGSTEGFAVTGSGTGGASFEVRNDGRGWFKGDLTVQSNMYVSADGSSGYVASRIWLYSHNNYRGAGIYLSGTDSTWFAGTGYTDFSGTYIISRRGVAGDDSTAWSNYRLWQVSSSGSTYQTGSISADGTITSASSIYATAATARIQAGSTSSADILYDSSRSALVARGNYPHVEIFSEVSNSNHGGTLRFTGYDNGSSGAYKSWNIGAPGSDLYFLDFAYGGTSNSNPHAGIAGLGAAYSYPGAFNMMRLHNNGNIGIGNFGTYGSEGNTPAFKLDVRGTGRFTGALSANTSITVGGGGDALAIAGAEGRITFRDQALVWTGYVGFRGNLGVVEFPGRNVQVSCGYNGTVEINTGTNDYLSGKLTVPFGTVNARRGFTSESNPWGTSDSSYHPNGITTAGSTNWIYGLTYLGNAPSNGSGAEVAANGRSYFRSSNASGTWGYAGRFIDRTSAANNYVPWSFENEYGNHSWGIVARFHMQSNSGTDRPSIQFSSDFSNNRWSVGYCYPDDNFRITQNHGYRPDNSTNDGWGTERFRINTDGVVNVFNRLNIGSTSGRTVSIGDGTYANHILCDNNVDFAFNYNNGSTGGFGFFGGTSSAKFMCSSGGTLTVSGDVVAYGTPSDARLKDIKEKVPNALDAVLKLNGYRFDWKERELNVYGDDKKILHIKEDIGVIAQEVADVLPELAKTNEDGFMSVRYQGLTAVLIEAVKEQQTQIESQKSEIEELKDLVKQLINR